MPMTSREQRQRRRKRIRKNVWGTPDRPRLSVFRSNKHIYAQIIDDIREITLSAASSVEPQIREEDLSGMEQAERVGQMLAERAVEQNVEQVVFDRGGYQYHGRIKALADAARENGLDF